MLYILLSISRANVQDQIVREKVITHVKPSKRNSSEDDSTQGHSSCFSLQLYPCTMIPHSQQAANTISSCKGNNDSRYSMFSAALYGEHFDPITAQE